MTRQSVPPQLADLLSRYLRQQTTAQSEGLGHAEPFGEVIPHEAAAVQPVDPRQAWSEALAAIHCFRPTEKMPPTIPGWPMLVASHEPEMALAFAVGSFPQLVRNLHPLVQAADLTALRASAGRPVSVPGLDEWAEKVSANGQYLQLVLAIGAMRLAHQFERATELLRRFEPNVPTEWQSLWANETAALAWHRGNADEAIALWSAQADSIPVLFNRGMAALFTGRISDARSALAQVVPQISEESGWHHLGRFYLALAEMRG